MPFDFSFYNDIVATIRSQSNVLVIYVSLFLCLFLSIYLNLYIIFSKKDLAMYKYRKYSQFLDFSINFPLTLGVMGTLISISTAVSSGDVIVSHDISDIITENLSSAVMTTVMGGGIYGFSFALQAFTFSLIND